MTSSELSALLVLATVMAVDKVVLGPGVKLLTVASTSRALSSEGVMALNVVLK